MLKQIFKKNVPQKLLFDLLEQICLKTDKYYMIDMNAYKKMLFYKLNEPLVKELEDYYHASKMFYIQREMTYNSFINIVRHICKINNIIYTSEMKYNESKYTIVYNIYVG
jgi:hypothetical protein